MPTGPRGHVMPTALFFVSGALGLVYEVLWMRQLTAIFGGTALAATATLSGFFLGNAAGSAALGGRAQRWRRPMVAFGVLEGCVGLGALVVAPVLRLEAPLYAATYQVLAAHTAAFALVKTALAIAAIGPAAFCMGGTLPALSEAVATQGSRLGGPVGRLYAVNLAGATLGTLAVPFALLPRFGVAGALAAAVAGSTCVAAIAIVAGVRGAARPGWNAAVPRAREVAAAPRVLALAALSGFATLSLELSWTRMLALVHENSLYSFAVVTCIFLAGLAGGAALARIALKRGHDPGRCLAAAWAAAAALAVASPRLLYGLTDGFGFVAATERSGALVRLLGLSLATMLLPTLALGAALPLLMDMLGTARRSSGAAIGRLLAANTLAAIAGPVATTFVLAAWLGPWWSIVATGAVLLAGAVAATRTRAARALAAAAFGAAIAVLRPGALPPVRVDAAHGERLVAASHGPYGTTAVIADDHDRWITVDNSYVLGGAADAEEERFAGHLPLLLHPAPRRVAFVGLGTAITAGAALAHPVDDVVGLEIVPDVARAARAHFGDVNRRLLDDPRVRIVVDDGRNYLAAAPERFDVIVGDLLVPWRPGEAPLYALEHFVSVRRALAPGGVFCQWLPLYQLSDEQLAVVARTFVAAFPNTTVWRGNFLPDAPTLALVGRTDDRPLDAAAIDARVRAFVVRAGDTPFLAHPAGVWLHLAGSLAPDDPRLRNATLDTDAEPVIELSSPPGVDGARAAAPSALTLAPDAAGGAALAALDAEHRAWWRAGNALAAAAREPGPEGQARVLAILRALPPELQRALEVAR